MGCDSYQVRDTTIRFNDNDINTGCLCMFPHNDYGQLSPNRLHSLALLGAAVVLANMSDNDFAGYCYLPDSLPQWIDKEICRVLNIQENNDVVVTN